MPFAVSDAVSQVLATALDGVSLRQRVIADNIANVDTPGFRATSVDFETQLRAAIDDGAFTAREGAPVDTGATTTPTDTPVGANGNNVDLRKETMGAIQSQFQYQMLTRAVSDRFNLVKTAATGQ
ncbi:flagellar basal body rod protein FlgB [Nocardioides marmoriginsengisoli]|uniref:Flagellar basal body rod protein FlgB n=1 Tax=Nocardioides marmoriginsengisoli TaxID=661483 RepID=A0A3N0CGT0_9ACTN|nr:flagellar basal body rod protein FlgB [Nocardioides marmoriginsengisoli]RNL62662.1 flagellar basal body rod protein FlgB [Nocardioides marmoriginsengisoli]